ncbi:MAG TPA: hypothetical protein VFF06_07370 [Polyangia bacterium]|nr:hypothetical protein [Polyangia bacterium]
MRALLVVLALATPALAFAQPTQVVQRWFAALEQKNFPQAMALTQGSALQRTEHMVGRLVAEAEAHHADVEVKVKHLEVRDEGGDVLVTFDIDIVGKKWFFRRVARTLAGTARFTLADGQRIDAIDGRLE